MALVPDLSAEVHRWGPAGGGVLIEFTLSGSAAGATLSWPAVDRIVLGEDEKSREKLIEVNGIEQAELLEAPRG